MKKHTAIVLSLILLALSACSANPTAIPLEAEAVTLEPSDSQSFVPSQRISNLLLDYVPAVRVSDTLEEGCTVIAECENDEFMHIFDYIYLCADEPVHDMMISTLVENAEYESAEPGDTGIRLYIPELLAGQTVRVLNAYPYSYQHSFDDGKTDYYTRIAYTNGSGEYETVILLQDNEKEAPALYPITLGLSGKKYDEDYAEYDKFFPLDFYEKMLTGAFDAYIPKGMCIAAGSLGDVNEDGIEDALIGLITGGNRVAQYMGSIPMLVLIGQPDGTYVVEKRNTEALFTPYRSESYPIAGKGYIDIMYDYVGGGACYHQHVSRFWYDEDKNDWLLREFSYQPTFAVKTDELEPQSPLFVSSLPDFMDTPLEKFTRKEALFYDSLADWDSFDAVNTFLYSRNIYTLAVNLNEATGYYEGYIHKYYESLDSGGFIQTIRGEYISGSELIITASEKDVSFSVCGDTWAMNKVDVKTDGNQEWFRIDDEDAFYRIK